MSTPPTEPSPLRALEALVLRSAGAERLTIVDRIPSAYRTAQPTEVVVCRIDDDAPRQVFCKYYPERAGHDARARVRLEASMLREVVQPLIGRQLCLGSYFDAESGGSWLVLEYLSRAIMSNKTPGGMVLAAGWCARFHAYWSEREKPALPGLREFDADDYRCVAETALSFSSEIEVHVPGLQRLCAELVHRLPLLVETPSAIIHGDYYADNVLIEDGRAFPIDWEAASMAAGELDLASLIEGWDDATKAACEHEYRQVRWPAGAPAEHSVRLDLARVYWLLRWLQTPAGLKMKGLRARLREAEAAAARLGIPRAL
jgi:hypothetical protein